MYINRSGVCNFQEVFLNEGGIRLPFFKIFPIDWLQYARGATIDHKVDSYVLKEEKNMIEGACFHINPGSLCSLEREIK